MKLALVALAVLGCAAERSRPEGDVTGRIHPPGILDEDSDSFHGRELARRDYDFGLCAKCHGDDFSGGTAAVSCLECHDEPGGPTACATCHRENAETGAHALHRARGIDCAECHTVPTRWSDDGHIRRAGMADPRPAEVVFGARAALTPVAHDRLGPPQLAAGRCTNVYCHGAVLGNGGGLATAPRWDDPQTGSCDRCHGAPPPSHAQADCASCHPPGAPHIDGAVQIGRTDGCDGCHGRNGDPAPPLDLDGNEFTTALGVGAHQAHLVGPSRVRGPIPCSTCHVVPGAVDSPGHLDSALPAEVDAAVGWSRGTATCDGYCHGPATPVWTVESGTACGSCHGVPPATASHASATSISTCTTCHPRVLDMFGNFLFTAGVSEHLDGDVDAF